MNLKFFSFVFAAILLIANAGNTLAQHHSNSSEIDRRAPGNPDLMSPSLQKSINEIQAAGMWDTNFANFASRIDGGEINAFLAVGDTLFIAGDFRYLDTVQAYHIIEYNRRTKTFSKLGDGFSGVVQTLAWHKGKLYAGGKFSRPGFKLTTSLQHIAVYDGTTWSAVGGGVNDDVYALAFMGDSLFVGGYFTKAGTKSIKYLALWDGTAWSNRSFELDSGVTALYVHDTTLYIGGIFEQAEGLTLDRVGMLTPSGFASMAGSLNGIPRTFAMVNDTLWVGGDFLWDANYTIKLFGLTKFDGHNWIPFERDHNVGVGPGLVYQIVSIDTAVYVLGNFTNVVGIPANGIAKYSKGVWSGLPSDLYGEGHCAISFDGTLWVGGRFSTAGALAINGLARFDGTTWSSIGTGRSIIDGYNTLGIFALAADNQNIYVGGNFTRIGNTTANNVAAWNRTTRKWSMLGGGVDENVRALTLFGDKLYVGGSFHRAGALPAEHIACWNTATATWSAMGTGTIHYVSAIAADQTGVYSVDYDSSFLRMKSLVRWDGNNWLQVPGFISGTVNSICLVNGDIYIGGYIGYANVPVNNIAFFDGKAWNPMGAGFDNEVFAIASFGGNLYAGGAFKNSGTIATKNMATWNGRSWVPVGTGVTDSLLPSEVKAMAATKDGLYVGGHFATGDGRPLSNFAKWDGAQWSDLSGGADNTIDAVAYESSANVVAVGGFFTDVNMAAPLESYRFGVYDLGSLAVANSSPLNLSTLSNSPNPFSNRTTFHFTLKDQATVRLDIYNELGALERTVEERYASGAHELMFDGSTLPTGVYEAVLRVGATSRVAKIMVQQ